ncbi:hypothetical protein [Thermosulfurimonas sp. F29]|uniref:hypothetical protein n=1 Tax=Thermosulfurimonas sp. F29 TaxID=2867247 RepID=UPI001C837B44|nr:hypothetical protein [Thermosulfurimonas sp. F29]MBX6424224.1 hypothetical protein [Thermosulfurimonas sp. F29]
MNYRGHSQDDPVHDTILILIFSVAFIILLVLAFALIPPLRCVLYASVLLVKGVEAVLAFEPDVARTFLEATWYYLTHPSAAMRMPVTQFFRAVWEAQASPLRTAVAGAGFCAVGWLVLRRRLRRIPSEKKLLQRIKNTPPEKVLEEDFGVRERLNLSDPRKAAESFARIRMRANVPPAVVARTVRDRRVRLALLYYRDFLEKGRVLWPVSDPEKLKRLRERELKRRQQAEEE